MRRNRIFKVDRILEMELRGRKRYFRVLWEGLPASEATWEPEDNLHSELVSEFLASTESSRTKSPARTKSPRVTRSPVRRAKTQLDASPKGVRQSPRRTRSLTPRTPPSPGTPGVSTRRTRGAAESPPDSPAGDKILHLTPLTARLRLAAEHTSPPKSPADDSVGTGSPPPRPKQHERPGEVVFLGLYVFIVLSTTFVLALNHQSTWRTSLREWPVLNTLLPSTPEKELYLLFMMTLTLCLGSALVHSWAEGVDAKAYGARAKHVLFSATALVAWAAMDRWDVDPVQAQKTVAQLLVAFLAQEVLCHLSALPTARGLRHLLALAVFHFYDEALVMGPLKLHVNLSLALYLTTTIVWTVMGPPYRSTILLQQFAPVALMCATSLIAVYAYVATAGTKDAVFGLLLMAYQTVTGFLFMVEAY